MKKAWREVVTGISAQCQPTNIEVVVCRLIPGHLTLVHAAESWKEEERLVSTISWI